MLMLFPQSIWLEEEDAAREAAENHVTKHVNLSFPESNAVFSFLLLILHPVRPHSPHFCTSFNLNLRHELIDFI